MFVISKSNNKSDDQTGEDIRDKSAPWKMVVMQAADPLPKSEPCDSTESASDKYD